MARVHEEGLSLRIVIYSNWECILAEIER